MSEYQAADGFAVGSGVMNGATGACGDRAGWTGPDFAIRCIRRQRRDNMPGIGGAFARVGIKVDHGQHVGPVEQAFAIEGGCLDGQHGSQPRRTGR